jgi:NADPH:quinone reductase-like Zn-dependent oxidoreductase
MQAIVQNQYGDLAEVMTVQHLDVPGIGADEMLVSVKMSAVSRAETILQSGTKLDARLFAGITAPRMTTPGMAIAGVVAAVGTDVDGFRVGDRVYGSLESAGGLAEQAVVRPTDVVRTLPDALTFEDAIGILEAHTAFYFLHDVAAVQPGQRVLVNGASGTVGNTAVQIARHLGAHVVGVCSGVNAARVAALGAHEVIDYTQTPLAELEGRYDLVLDAVGTTTFPEVAHLVRDGGRFLTTSISASIAFWAMWTRLFGRKRAGIAFAGLNTEVRHLEALEQLVRDGSLVQSIDRVVGLAEVPEAFAYVASGRKRGNVLVSVAA